MQALDGLHGQLQVRISEAAPGVHNGVRAFGDGDVGRADDRVSGSGGGNCCRNGSGVQRQRLLVRVGKIGNDR
jgi:hypothetical protein